MLQKRMDMNFYLCQKCSGSTNKTYLFQQTKALLNQKSLLQIVRRKSTISWN